MCALKVGDRIFNPDPTSINYKKKATVVGFHAGSPYKTFVRYDDESYGCGEEHSYKLICNCNCCHHKD